MITKEDEKRIATAAALLANQPLTNSTFLLGCAYICRALDNLRVESRQCDELPNETIEFYDELMEANAKNFTYDKEHKIDPDHEHEHEHE